MRILNIAMGSVHVSWMTRYFIFYLHLLWFCIYNTPPPAPLILSCLCGVWQQRSAFWSPIPMRCPPPPPFAGQAGGGGRGGSVPPESLAVATLLPWLKYIFDHWAVVKSVPEGPGGGGGTGTGITKLLNNNSTLLSIFLFTHFQCSIFLLTHFQCS
jgi:hypothetical protein